MNAEHETHCTFAIHVEELFDGVHDKFHWSVIVVQDQHTPCRVLGGTQIGLLLSPQIIVARVLSGMAVIERHDDGFGSSRRFGHVPTTSALPPINRHRYRGPYCSRMRVIEK
jgi:hypothetical protein